MGCWAGVGDLFRGSLAIEADSLITQISKITVLSDTELRVFTEGTTVPTGAITLNNVENDFRGDLSASGQNMTLADANDLALRDFRVTGVLTIQTGGN